MIVTVIVRTRRPTTASVEVAGCCVWQKSFNVTSDCCAEHCLSMSKEEKRKLYACGSKYVTLDDIDTWQTQQKKRRVRCKYPSGEYIVWTLHLT